MAITKYRGHQSENVILPYEKFPSYQQIEKIQPLDKIQAYTPIYGWDDERRAVYNARKNKQIKTFLSNYNDPTELNSYIDALTNREAVSKKFGETWGTLSTISGMVSVLSFAGSIIAGALAPFTGGASLAAAAPLAKLGAATAVPAIPAAVDVTIEKGIKPILAGKPGEALINTFMNIGETADAIANPVKGLILEGPEGFAKATGLAAGGRVNYDYDTGFFLTDMLLEMISDPMNWVDFGTDILLKKPLKAAAEQFTDPFFVAIKEASQDLTFKELFGDFTEESLERVRKKVNRTISRVSQDWNISAVKGLTETQIKDGQDAILNTFRRALKKERPNLSEQSINLLLENATKLSKTQRANQSILAQISNVTLDKLSTDTIRGLSSVKYYSESFQKHLTKMAFRTSGYGGSLYLLKNAFDPIKTWYHKTRLNKLASVLPNLFNKDKGFNLSKWGDVKQAWKTTSSYGAAIAQESGDDTIQTLQNALIANLDADKNVIEQLLLKHKNEPIVLANAIDAFFTQKWGYGFQDHIGYLKAINTSEGYTLDNYINKLEVIYKKLNTNASQKAMGNSISTLPHVMTKQTLRDLVSENNLTDLRKYLLRINKKKDNKIDTRYTLKFEDATVTEALLNTPEVQQIKNMLLDTSQGVGHTIVSILADPNSIAGSANPELRAACARIYQAIQGLDNVQMLHTEISTITKLPINFKIQDFQKYLLSEIYGLENVGTVAELYTNFESTVSTLYNRLKHMYELTGVDATTLFEESELDAQIRTALHRYLEAQYNLGAISVKGGLDENFTSAIDDFINHTLEITTPETQDILKAANEEIKMLRLIKEFNDANFKMTGTQDMFDAAKLTIPKLTTLGLAQQTVIDKKALDLFEFPKDISELYYRDGALVAKRILKTVEQAQQFTHIFDNKNVRAQIQKAYTAIRNLVSRYNQENLSFALYRKLKETDDVYTQYATICEIYKSIDAIGDSTTYQTITKLLNDSVTDKSILDGIYFPSRLLRTEHISDPMSYSIKFANKQFKDRQLSLLNEWRNFNTQLSKGTNDMREVRKLYAENKADNVKAVILDRYIRLLDQADKIMHILKDSNEALFNKGLVEIFTEQMYTIFNTQPLIQRRYKNVYTKVLQYWQGAIELHTAVDEEATKLFIRERRELINAYYNKHGIFPNNTERQKIDNKLIQKYGEDAFDEYTTLYDDFSEMKFVLHQTASQRRNKGFEVFKTKSSENLADLKAKNKAAFDVELEQFHKRINAIWGTEDSITGKRVGGFYRERSKELWDEMYAQFAKENEELVKEIKKTINAESRKLHVDVRSRLNEEYIWDANGKRITKDLTGLSKEELEQLGVIETVVNEKTGEVYAIRRRHFADPERQAAYKRFYITWKKLHNQKISQWAMEDLNITDADIFEVTRSLEDLAKNKTGKTLDKFLSETVAGGFEADILVEANKIHERLAPLYKKAKHQVYSKLYAFMHSWNNQLYELSQVRNKTYEEIFDSFLKQYDAAIKEGSIDTPIFKKDYWEGTQSDYSFVGDKIQTVYKPDKGLTIKVSVDTPISESLNKTFTLSKKWETKIDSTSAPPITVNVTAAEVKQYQNTFNINELNARLYDTKQAFYKTLPHKFDNDTFEKRLVEFQYKHNDNKELTKAQQNQVYADYIKELNELNFTPEARAELTKRLQNTYDTYIKDLKNKNKQISYIRDAKGRFIASGEVIDDTINLPDDIKNIKSVKDYARYEYARQHTEAMFKPDKSYETYKAKKLTIDDFIDPKTKQLMSNGAARLKNVYTETELKNILDITQKISQEYTQSINIIKQYEDIQINELSDVLMDEYRLVLKDLYASHTNPMLSNYRYETWQEFREQKNHRFQNLLEDYEKKVKPIYERARSLSDQAFIDLQNKTAKIRENNFKQYQQLQKEAREELDLVLSENDVATISKIDIKAPFKQQIEFNKLLNNATNSTAKNIISTRLAQTPQQMFADLAHSFGHIIIAQDDLKDLWAYKALPKLIKDFATVGIEYVDGGQYHMFYIKDWDKITMNNSQVYFNTNPITRVIPTKDNTAYRLADQYLADNLGEKSNPIQQLLNKADSDFLELTGVHTGYSQGEVFNQDSFRKYFMHLPEKFREALGEQKFIDYMTDEQFFKTLRFNESYIASMHNKHALSIHASNAVFNTRNAYLFAENFVKAKTEFINTVFDSSFSINSTIYTKFTNEELLKALQANTDYKMLALVDDPRYGIKVRIIEPLSVEHITKAKELNAVIVPLQIAKEMYNKVNHRLGSEGFLKYWNRLLYLYKFGYLCRPGAWIRNWFDTNFKSKLEMGDENLEYQIRAHKIINEYDNIQEYVLRMKAGNDKLTIDEILQQYFDSNKQSILNFETYKELQDNYFSQGVADNIMAQTMKELKGTKEYDLWTVTTETTGRIIEKANDTERYNRLATYLYNIEKGLDTTAALAQVSKIHFDYSFKNTTEQLIEMIFPFTTFSLRNFSYWVEMVEKHPWLIRNYIHLMKPHWDFKDYTPEELARDYRVQRQIINGQLKLAEFNNKIITFKVNPSVQDAIAMFSDPINNVYEKLAAPIAVPLATATGEYTQPENMLPIVGPIISSAKSMFKTGTPLPSAIGVQPTPRRTGIDFRNKNLSGINTFRDKQYRIPNYRKNVVYDSYATRGVNRYRTHMYPVIDIAHDIKMRYTINVYNRIKNKIKTDVYQGIRYRIKLDANRFR